jgi:hypothetical protein
MERQNDPKPGVTRYRDPIHASLVFLFLYLSFGKFKEKDN